MNFLDLIWLIPLFPLAGAAAMLLIGRKLDPQGHSDVALAPALAAEHGGDHGGGHAHGEHHYPATRRLIAFISPGAILLSLLLSLGAVAQLASLEKKSHEVILYTWITGLPFHTATGALSTFTADWGFLLDQIGRAHV